MEPRIEEPHVRLVRLVRELTAATPGLLIIGIDGRSGSGKSTLAAAVASHLGRSDDLEGPVTVIEGDDFYGGGSAETWDRLTSADKAERVIDWRRQRVVLEQLREVGQATWRPFDWDADDWDRDTVPLAAERVVARAGRVVILDGAYSCRPELHDLLDLRVLLDIPREVRRRQLLQRQGDAFRSDWDARWSAAEDHYFSKIMPAARFDLRLGGLAS